MLWWPHFFWTGRLILWEFLFSQYFIVFHHSLTSIELLVTLEFLRGVEMLDNAVRFWLAKFANIMLSGCDWQLSAFWSSFEYRCHSFLESSNLNLDTKTSFLMVFIMVKLVLFNMVRFLCVVVAVSSPQLKESRPASSLPYDLLMYSLCLAVTM